MALKSKPPPSGAGRGGEKIDVSFEKATLEVAVAAKAPSRRRQSAPVETTEARLERKAAIADTKTFATRSLGQMTREQRHKLLYGD